MLTCHRLPARWRKPASIWLTGIIENLFLPLKLCYLEIVFSWFLQTHRSWTVPVSRSPCWLNFNKLLVRTNARKRQILKRKKNVISNLPCCDVNVDPQRHECLYNGYWRSLKTMHKKNPAKWFVKPHQQSLIYFSWDPVNTLGEGRRFTL